MPNKHKETNGKGQVWDVNDYTVEDEGLLEEAVNQYLHAGRDLAN